VSECVRRASPLNTAPSRAWQRLARRKRSGCRRYARNYTARGGATAGGWLSGRAQGGTMPVPWGDIPARPFLGIGQPEVAEIEESVKRAVKRALAGA